MKKKIDLQKFSKEELTEIIVDCFSLTDFAVKLGFASFNGQISKKVGALLSQHQINTDHFDPMKKNRERRKYPIIKKNCPVCGAEFETLQGDPKEKTTCSPGCSNTFFSDSKHSEEANKKRSQSLIKYYEANGYPTPPGPRIKVGAQTYIECTKNCLFCQVEFKTIKRKQKYCSQSCATKANWQNPEYRNTLVSGIQERIDNGTHSGWTSRSKIEPSFPEKITMEILAELGIVLEKDFRCSKWFIDFADIERKIAIEIDGKQHELPERKSSDEHKDAYLIQEGWQVHRIKWKKLSKETRIELKQKLIEILR